MTAVELALPLTAGPDLPPELAPNEDTGGNPFGAYIRHGRRSVSWRFHHHDGHELYRNAAAWAWFTVAELRPFTGEPLSVQSERRMLDHGPLEPFTDAAQRRIDEAVLPAVARYGFDRWWRDLHAGTVDARSYATARDDAHRAAAWHDDLIELRATYATGLVDIRPLPAGMATTTAERDARRRSIIEHGTTRVTVTEVMAELRLDGDLIGWLTTAGDPIPLDDKLSTYWTRR